MQPLPLRLLSKPQRSGCTDELGAKETRLTLAAYKKIGREIKRAHASALADAGSRGVPAARPELSIRDFGGRPEPGVNNQPAIVMAMKACTEHGGCTLTFPPADVGQRVSKTVYLTSSFSLVSNLTLHVPPGVVLRGTETDADNMLSSQLWPTLPWLEHPSMPCNDCPYTCGAGCGPTKRAWLYGQNVSGVRITGGGTLHGGGEHGHLYSVVYR